MSLRYYIEAAGGGSTIPQKTIKIGTYKEGSKTYDVNIDISVKKREQESMDWQTLKPVENRSRLSISGDISREDDDDWLSGQIDDSLRKMYRKGELSLTIPKGDFHKLLAIWKQYNLNDIVPGSKEQMAKVRELKAKGFDTSANNYGVMVKKIPEDRGYKYGSAWLTKDIPEKVISFLAGL